MYSNIQFSVLMSVYKKESANYFDMALNSILVNQTLLPNEMILVCDGPLTDELDAIVANYEVSFPNIIRVFRLDKNYGLGYALNFGLQKCSYEYVARADSDDICVPERFEKQIDFLEKHPDITVLGSYIDEFDTDWNRPDRKKELPIYHAEICKMALFRNPLNHMTIVFKKSDIESIGSYQHLPYLEDYYLWVRAIASGAILANIGECLVHARVGNGMIQRRGNKLYINSWKVLNKYMIKQGMLSQAKYFRNMISVCAFVYTPKFAKQFIYNYILRK